MEQETKSLIDRIWTNFWEGGVANPLTVIEQITYLLFIKGLDDIDIANEKSDNMLGIQRKRIFDEKHQNCRWSIFKNYPSEKMYKIVQEDVFPFIKELSSNQKSGYVKYMEDAIFIIPTPIMLQKVVTALDKLKMKDRDTKGDVYEYLLSKLSNAGTIGQFRTPRHIIKMMVELMKPTPEDIIVDPACGSTGFLVAAGEYLRDNRNDLFMSQNLKKHFNNSMFYGFDMDRTMLRIGAMNLMQHGIENPNILYKDSLSEDNEDSNKYTLVLANPPFKGSIDSERTSKDLLAVTKTKKTELLFLALFLKILKTGGRVASIVPDGVLFGSSNAHKSIRKEIIENQKLEAIISMPSGVFKPYAGVSTAIMIFTKTNDGGTDKVWFYDMTADGFSLDDQRQPVKENDIPNIIERFNNRASKEEQERKRTEKSFFVSKEEIVENDYDLSINKYKEIIVEKKEYEKPENILNSIAIQNVAINESLIRLRSVLIKPIVGKVGNGLRSTFGNPIIEETGNKLNIAMESFNGQTKNTVACLLESIKPQFDGLMVAVDKMMTIIKHSELSIRLNMAENNWLYPFEIKNIEDFYDQSDYELKIESEYSKNNNEKFKLLIDYIKSYKNINSTIIEESRFAYENKAYGLCVYSLAPIIEGLLEDETNKQLRGLSKLFNNIENKYKDRRILDVPAMQLITLKKFINNYSAYREFSEKEPEMINRHWLLHGRSNRRFSNYDCLQLYGAIYTIIQILEVNIEELEVENENS